MILHFLSLAALARAACTDTSTPMPVVQNSHRISVNGSVNGISFSFAAYVSPNTFADPGFAPTQGHVWIHGQGRNADEMVRTYKVAFPEAVDAGYLASDQDAVMLAPIFAHSDDAAASMFPDVLTWCGNEWMEGRDAQQANVSSFNVLRASFDWLAQQYPSITTFVLAGHSAGGQIVQRWAITNPLNTSPDRYVIANPSSVAYFTADRPNCTASAGCVCTAPLYSACCTGFNDWKYGLEDYTPRYQHAAIAPANSSALLERYVARTIHYLYGTLDDEGQMNGCESNAQGLGHFDRGQKWWTYLTGIAPSVTATQTKDNVDGVGHDSAGMFGSDMGVARLFT